MVEQVYGLDQREASRGVDRKHDSDFGDHLPITTLDGVVRWGQWWRDLYAYRGALASLMWRNVKSRYKQATLGVSWAVLQPLVQVGVFTVLFGILAGFPSGDVPYPLFALAGLASWNLFSRIVSDGSTSLVANQQIITKLFFPRIYLVIAAGASALLDAAVTLILLLGLMAVYGFAPGPQAWMAIPAFLGVVVCSYGLASLLAAINARWRDVQHTIPFLLQMGLFTTPVIYSNSMLPERWRWVVAMNPLTGLVELFRSAMLGLPLPEPGVYLTSLGVAAVVVVFGVWQFTRSEAMIVDVL